jgi:DNA-nicking Smr family endonuclease
MTDFPSRPPETPPPAADDGDAWGKEVRDVRPLPPSEKGAGSTKGTSPKPLRGSVAAPPRPPLEMKSANGKQATPPNPGFDRRSAQRLREGRMEIDGRIDLHGMTLPQAHGAVITFIQRMAAANKRCLLVITGKGERETPKDMPWYEQPRGQIRQMLPVWLAEPDLASLILSTAPARPEHGGSGACYVLLRRNRD